MAIEQPFVVANAALEDPTDLRGLLEMHSYLYFRRLVPEEPILTARRDILELCRGAGWLDAAAPGLPPH